MKRNGTPKVKGALERPIGSGCGGSYYIDGKAVS